MATGIVDWGRFWHWLSWPRRGRSQGRRRQARARQRSMRATRSHQAHATNGATSLTRSVIAIAAPTRGEQLGSRQTRGTTTRDRGIYWQILANPRGLARRPRSKVEPELAGLRFTARASSMHFIAQRLIAQRRPNAQRARRAQAPLWLVREGAEMGVISVSLEGIDISKRRSKVLARAESGRPRHLLKVCTRATSASSARSARADRWQAGERAMARKTRGFE